VNAARGLALGAALAVALVPAIAGATFTTFESGQVRPLALSPDGTRLFAVNTPDDQVEVFTVAAGGLTHLASVPVGLEPVAVAARTNGEIWVVNHLSDSISIVDVAATPPRVIRTLLVGDEPRDLVFAGPGRSRAFVTAAHRGQNRPGDPQLTTAGVGRADVWVFDSANLGAALGGTPLSILTLFTDTPRALAATADGATVLAAGFHTGNRTTTINEGLVCNGGAGVAPCNVSGFVMPGGLPAPNTNADLVPQPEVGLILKFDGATWRDPVGRNWNNAVRFSLPDKDFFAIDANATPPAELAFASGIGTIIYDMAVSPTGQKVYVANTEARNEVRFEGPGVFGGSTVRGHLHEARITILSQAGGIVHRRLNKHIDYAVVPSPAGVKERSLATPAALALSADGATLYVAAFGSSKVGVFDTAALEADTFVPDAASHITVTGGGPNGLVLDEAHQRLYVLTRFDDAISVVDTATRQEIAHLPMHDPEPASVIAGRKFLYDATLTSSNGEASCGACHVFGDFDSLAWDLGNPDDSVLDNQNPLRPGLSANPDFHPMKGPMTTQSLRGMANQGPMHWRGDRNGTLDAPSVPPNGGNFDEVAAFKKFNAAFGGLLGRSGPLTTAEMQAFADFILQVQYPPNPIRNLDGSLTPDQLAGRNFYFNSSPSDSIGTCNFCHVLDPAIGFFGTDGRSVIEPQAFKVPHLRNAYQKVGMFGMPHAPGLVGFNAGDNGAKGDQVRGFGFQHDGSVDTLFRFFDAQGFNQSGGNPGGFAPGAAGDLQRRQVEQFMLAFDSDLAPIVGQQVSAMVTTFGNAAVIGRVNLMIARHEAGECELTVKGVLAGEARGWLYDDVSNTFHADRDGDAPLAEASLRGQAASAGQTRTYTCVPPGSGLRIGIDRDEDGFRDRDEVDAGSDPADASSTPGSPDTTVMIRGSSMSLRDDSTPPVNPAVRRIRLKSGKHKGVPSGVVPPAWDSAGDPTVPGSAGGALLTVYNGSGSGEAVTVVLPAANWRRLGSTAGPRGYRYADGQHLAGPISSVSVTSSGTLVIAGAGPTWPYTLNEPSQGTVAVRLRLGQGDVWCTAFPAKPSASGANDRVDKFVGAPNLPIPGSCPPVP
jgi:DNA-binding beta-propeller fold protein YncE